jgi:GT2 family glycosyltransferase
MTNKTVAYFTLHGNDPCASIRILNPFAMAGFQVYQPDPSSPIDESTIASCDFIVIQRSFPQLFDVYTSVMQISRLHQIPVVYEIDDLLFDLPLNHTERVNGIFTEGLLPMLQALVEADYVTVPTLRLQMELSAFNPNIEIIPNYLDDHLWDLKEPVLEENKSPLVIGYMGTETHKPDLELLTPVFIDLNKMYPGKLHFRFWGMQNVPELANLKNIEFFPPITDSYQNFVRFFQKQTADIFVAPLRENRFNRCKSPIKFFEYTSLGVPGVYANMEPYQLVVQHGINGFLANNVSEWIENLQKLIESPELRNRIATKAQEKLRNEHLLSNNTHRLSSFFSDLTFLKTEDFHAKKHWLNTVRPINLQYQNLSLSKFNEIAQLNQYLNEKAIQINQKNTELEEKNAELKRRDIQIEKKVTELEIKKNELAEKNSELNGTKFELNEIKISKVWKIALLFRKTRLVLAPPNSKRAKFLRNVLHFLQGEKIRVDKRRQEKTLSTYDFQSISLNCKEVLPHTNSVDIIVCIHNALEDVKRCLQSITENSNEPYQIILVDDGSQEPTEDYLKSWSSERKNVKLIRNKEAKGYTLAANIGLRASTADFVVLINSDTIVSKGWLDRMCQIMTDDESVGVVGPLSNTASWQSIPELTDGSDWATNPLPKGITVENMAELVSKHSACIHLEVPLLNGFCMMIRKKALIDIGYLDEENFGQGYGEEDDFNLRAGEKGWKKIIADDVYVYHAQSKSYSSDRRHQLSRISGAKLNKKHGSDNIAKKVAFMNPNRVMEGIRAHTRFMIDREQTINEGRSQFAGKKILFILPVIDAGGGANVIIDEAISMQKMGVDVQIMNLPEYRHSFLQNYKHSPVPFVFESIENLPELAMQYDAVIASAHYSVPWLKPLEEQQPRLKLGYYIQGFEALMYPDGSKDAQIAIDSYTLVRGIRSFTKTNWTKKQIEENTGASPEVIGISVNNDLFRPRASRPFGEKPVHIAAMIRPASPYRNPDFTAKILRDIKKQYQSDVEIFLFGANDVKEIVSNDLLDFDYHQLGKLSQLEVARLMSYLDIFTDYSTHQAMGLSALEAMASGCTVIVPENGGAIEFIEDRKTGIVVDTTSYDKSLAALQTLIEDDNLRKSLQIASIKRAANLYPEKCAFNILKVLFD